MKSIKGLALGAALAGVVFTGAAAADAATNVGHDVVGTEYEEATTKLAALNITKGYPDGTVRPDENVTRAQTAAFMIRALNYQLAMDQSTTVFNDVVYEHPLSGAVQLASGKGIIKGYLDGTFRPEESVTIAQASAILVRMLGYGPAINEADFPNSHLSKAAELGVLKGVKADVNAPAKRGDIMKMVANSLTIDIMKQTEWGNDHKWEEKEDENLLTEYFDLTVVETRKDFKDKIAGSKNYDGDLPRVADTARTNIKGLKSYEVIFDGMAGTHDLNEMFNPSDFLGQEVQLWVDEDEDYVAYIAKSKDETVIFDKFDKWDYKDKEDIIKLDNGDDYDVLEDAQVYYNLDKPVAWEKFKDSSNYKAMDAKGSTSLVKVVLDSKDNVKVLVVDNISANASNASYGIVDSVNLDKEMIDFMDGSSSTSQLKLDGKDFFITRNGKVAELKDLEKEDVINYLRNGDEYYILATSNKVSGTVDNVEFTRDDDVSSYKLYIDGKKYNVAMDATYSDNENEDIDDVDTDDLDEMDGVSATLYLDAAGEIRHILTGELGTTTGNVAVVTKNVKWLSQDEEWELTIVNENGKEVKYRFEYDDIDVDGAERTDEYIYQELTIDSEYSNVKDQYKKGRISGDVLNKKIENGYVFIEYSVNKDGELKDIDILRTEAQMGEWEARYGDNEKAPKDKYSNLIAATGDNAIKLDKYDDNVKIAGQTYKVTRNSVFFDVTDKDFSDGEYDDVDTVKWDDIKDKETDIKEAFVKYKTNGRDIEYMFVTDSLKNLKSKGDYGFITGFKKVGRDDALQITRIDGEKLTIVLDEKDPTEELKGEFLNKKGNLKTKGAFIRYELDSDDEIDDWQVIATAGNKGGFYIEPGSDDENKTYRGYSIEYVNAGVVEKSTTSSITLVQLEGQKDTTKKGNVVVNNDTVYIDLVDDGEMEFVGGVNSGDFVLAVDTDDDGNAADFVIIIGEDYRTDGTGKDTSDKDKKVEDGEVTYINAEEGLIEVDGDVLELDKRVKLVDADGNTVEIGPKAVAAELEKLYKKDKVYVELKAEDGVITEIKLRDEKVDPTPVDPEDPEEQQVTATVKDTASGIGKILTIDAQGYEDAVSYVAKAIVDGEDIVLNKAKKLGETSIVFGVEAGDIIKVELLNAKGEVVKVETVEVK